jgi:hypothetical protein
VVLVEIFRMLKTGEIEFGAGRDREAACHGVSGEFKNHGSVE